jgi:hypothetical protein
MPLTNDVVANKIAPRPYTPSAPTASAGKCGSRIVPISERGALITSDTAKAPTTRIAPIALDTAIVHGGIRCPSPRCAAGYCMSILAGY